MEKHTGDMRETSESMNSLVTPLGGGTAEIAATFPVLTEEGDIEGTTLVRRTVLARLKEGGESGNSMVVAGRSSITCL